MTLDNVAAPPTSASAFERWIAEGEARLDGLVGAQCVETGGSTSRSSGSVYHFISHLLWPFRSGVLIQSGVVARYAVRTITMMLAEPLEALTRFHLSLAEEPEAKALWYVDGPIP